MLLGGFQNTAGMRVFVSGLQSWMCNPVRYAAEMAQVCRWVRGGAVQAQPVRRHGIFQRLERHCLGVHANTATGTMAVVNQPFWWMPPGMVLERALKIHAPKVKPITPGRDARS